MTTALGNGFAGGISKPAFRPLRNWLSHPSARHNSIGIARFEPDAVFLEMDSSWHNRIKRSRLLPGLRRSGVRMPICITMQYLF